MEIALMECSNINTKSKWRFCVISTHLVSEHRADGSLFSFLFSKARGSNFRGANQVTFWRGKVFWLIRQNENDYIVIFLRQTVRTETTNGS